MADNVKLGIIGLGGWGTKLAHAAQRTDQIEITLAYARSHSARTSFADEFGCRAADDLRTMLDSDIDGVVIATPHSTHAELVTAAAEAGKSIFVEKPLTLGVRSAREAVDAAEEAGVILQVGHQRRRLAATRAVRQLVDTDELGQVHLIEATIASPGGLEPRPGWQGRADERPLGGMSGLGVHMIDTMQYVAGPSRRVTALSKPIVGDTGLDEVTALLIEYSDGPVGVLSNSTIGTRIAALAVHGTAGTAWSDEDGTRLYRQALAARTRTEHPVGKVDALADQFHEFAECVRTGARPEVDGLVALDVVAVLEAAALSVALEAAVDVHEVRETAR